MTAQSAQPKESFVSASLQFSIHRQRLCSRQPTILHPPKTAVSDSLQFSIHRKRLGFRQPIIFHLPKTVVPLQSIVEQRSAFVQLQKDARATSRVWKPEQLGSGFVLLAVRDEHIDVHAQP